MTDKKYSLPLSLLKKTNDAFGHIRNSLPHRCILCHQQTSSFKHYLCATCRIDLPYPKFLCLGCATELPNETKFCGHCLTTLNSHSLITACDYQTPIKELISSLKYKKNYSAAAELALHLSHRVCQYIDLGYIEQPQLLIPVPLHRYRQIKRGFNQAELIALHLGRLLGIPVANSCTRVLATPAQSHLNSQQRRHNLDRAFKLTSPIDANNIALIDDVYTTGATMRELSRTIEHSQKITIQYWCIARTLI